MKEQEFQDSIVKILTNEKKKKSELFLFSKREEMIKKLQEGSCSYLTKETTRNIVNNSYKRVFPESFRPTTAGQGLKSQVENIPLLILPPPETSALSLNRTSGTEDALHPVHHLPQTYLVQPRANPIMTKQQDGQTYYLSHSDSPSSTSYV